MGLFDLFRRNTAARTAPAPHNSASIETLTLTDERVREFLRGRYLHTESGVTVTPWSAMNVATAFRCVSILCTAVKTLPIDLRIRDGAKRVDASNHPLWNVLRKRPNSWMTPAEFKNLMQAMVLLRGNGYALIVRSMGEVKALIPLIGQMQVVQNADLSLTYKYTRLDGTQTEFAQSDMFHLRGMSLDGICGVSVISFAREALGISLQSEKHAAKQFKNGTSIAGVLEHPKELGDEEVERLREELEKFRGAENAHKNLVLENGMKYNKIEFSNVDLQYIQNREITQSEIAMFFGVPPHMLGMQTKQTSFGAGIEQQSIGFVAYTLQDWLTMWQETIERDLFAPDEDPRLYCRIDPNGLLRADFKTRMLGYAAGRQWGWWSVNDVRAKEDENPVEGGDTYLQPVNMVDATKATEALAAHDPNDQNAQE